MIDEKLKKALKTSKQGIWILLILGILVNLISIYTLGQGAMTFLEYIQTNLASLIQIGVLITALVIYRKERYVTGAEIAQWTGLGGIITAFANAIIGYILTGAFNVNVITLLISVLIPIILIVESLKVIRLAEQGERPQSKVALIAIAIIALVVVSNTLMLVKLKNDLDDALDKIKDQIQSGIMDNNQNTENDAEDKQEDNKQEENEDEKDDEPVDPYANYKKIEWSTNTSKDTKIKNNKLYFLNNEVDVSIDGTLEKVETIIIGGFPVMFVTTEENEAWYIALDDIVNNTVAVEKQLLTKEKIVDMTALKTYTSEYSDTTIYFLTEQGKLIDENGVSYDKYNFVTSFRAQDIGIWISIDKDSNGYYYNEKNNTFSAIVSKSTGAKLSFSKIYRANGKLLVVTGYNKLFEYDGKSNKATQLTGDVSSVKKVLSEELLHLAIIFKDGTTKIFEDATGGYDVKNKKEIDIENLKTFDPYENYKNLTWNTSTKIVSPVGITCEIKNGKLICTETVDGEVRTAEIKGMSGTPIKLKDDVIGGALAIYALTDTSMVYWIDWDGSSTLLADLRKHNVIDMVKVSGEHELVYNYYLTADGRLIDGLGISYNKNRFTDSVTVNVFNKIALDKNLYGYYYDNEKGYKVIQDKTTGKDIKITKIYVVDDYNMALLQSDDNKMYEYVHGSNKAILVGAIEKIMRIVDVDNNLGIVVELKNGTEAHYNKCSETAYDIVNKKDIDVTKIELVEPKG